MDVSQSGTSKRLCTAKDPLRGKPEEDERDVDVQRLQWVDVLFNYIPTLCPILCHAR